MKLITYMFILIGLTTYSIATDTKVSNTTLTINLYNKLPKTLFNEMLRDIESYEQPSVSYNNNPDVSGILNGYLDMYVYKIFDED